METVTVLWTTLGTPHPTLHSISLFSSEIALIDFFSRSTGGIARPHHSVDSSTGVEISLELHPDQIGGGQQVVGDAMCHLLVGHRIIAVAVDVELGRFELHHLRARLVNQAKESEIGVALEGALAGEFQQINQHLISPPQPRVAEEEQLVGNGTLAVKGGLDRLIRHEAEVERRSDMNCPHASR